MFPDGAINRDLTVLALPLAAGARGRGAPDHDRRAVGGDRHGRARQSRPGHHRLQRPGDAAVCSGGAATGRRSPRATSGRSSCGSDACRSSASWCWVSCMSLLTGETALVSIGLLSFAARGADRAGLSRRPLLAPRHGARRDRRHDGRFARLALSPVSSVARNRRRPSRPFSPTDRWRSAGSVRRGSWPSRRTPWSGASSFRCFVNVVAFVAFSLTRESTALERAQASAFAGAGGKPQAFRLWRSSTTAGELEAAVARYLGAARARRAFSAFMRESGQDYDPTREASAQLIRHAEFLLSPAIGASTSRQVLSLLLRPRTVSGQSALKLIDEASAAIQSNRDQLQHALDHARQGITVFDSNLALTAWNREFGELFDLPPALLRHGVGLDEIVRFNAARGAYGPGNSEDFVAERVASLLYDDQPTRLQALLHPSRDRDPLGPAAGRRHRHDLHRRDPDRADGGGARGGQRVPREAGRRAHRRIAAAERGACERQDRRGGGEPLEDALSRRRQPRHSPAAQRRATLRQLARGRARPDRRRRRARGSRAQGRHVAGGGRGDPGRPARHFAARRRRDEAGNLRRPGRRSDAHARGRVHAARALERRSGFVSLRRGSRSGPTGA